MKKKRAAEEDVNTQILKKKEKYRKLQNEVEEPVFKEVTLYDEKSKKVIGKHRVPILVTYEPEEKNKRFEEIIKIDENKILDFLNNVRTAQEIDKAVEIPNERDVGVKIGERILDERQKLGGFTNLQQINDIPYIGPERFFEIVMTLGVESQLKMENKDILDNLVQKIASVKSWDTIEISDEVKKYLRDICKEEAYRIEKHVKGEFRKKQSGKGMNVLFSGGSTTGKTLAAGLIANELNRDLYKIDLSSVIGKYIGETEKNIRKVFDEAEKSNAILFFDEADALFGKRSEVKDSHDRYANIEINYLLQKMEEYKGLCILATNMRQALDTAFMRRIRFTIEFPILDSE